MWATQLNLESVHASGLQTRATPMTIYQLYIYASIQTSTVQSCDVTFERCGVCLRDLSAAGWLLDVAC